MEKKAEEREFNSIVKKSTYGRMNKFDYSPSIGKSSSRDNSVILPDNAKIQQLRESLQIDEAKFITLEARMSGLPKEVVSEYINSNSNSKTFAQIEAEKRESEVEKSEELKNIIKKDPMSIRLNSITHSDHSSDSWHSQNSISENDNNKLKLQIADKEEELKKSSRKRKGNPKKRILSTKMRKMHDKEMTSKKKLLNKPLQLPVIEEKRSQSNTQISLYGQDNNSNKVPLSLGMNESHSAHFQTQFPQFSPFSQMQINHNSNSNNINFNLNSKSPFSESNAFNSQSQHHQSQQHKFISKEQHDTQIAEKNKEIDILNDNLKRKDDQINQLVSYAKTLEGFKKKAQEKLSKYLTQFEQFKRKLNKKNLNDQSVRLGQQFFRNEGIRFTDSWEEGDDFIDIKQRLHDIKSEKEELEKQKRQLNTKKIKRKSEGIEKRKSPVDDSFKNPLSPSNNDNLDDKEVLSFRLSLLKDEEARLNSKLEALEIEKCIFSLEFKRLKEEERCKYISSGLKENKDRYPILKNKYLILALLGKGGYSEVYKAYDLEANKEVACKIHEFNAQWSESLKANYIKHAIRENEIHKELDFPRIVRQFDTIEISHNSFCTVLELCDGPDLHLYLKTHKFVPEKEAKVIILQILSGLKYLNQHNTRIIHYDLKPQNILFHEGGIKISDFGLCKIMDETTTRIELTSQGVGTYWYLPPECFQLGKNPPLINSKVDVWSVGVIFYELLYGKKPFGHNMSQEKILKEQTIANATDVSFPPTPKVSKECKEFIQKCMAHNQHERYDVLEAFNSDYFRSKKN